MNAFVIVLTIFAAPVDVASNAPLTLQPETTITFENTTDKNTLAACNRVAKALNASGKIAYCGEVTAK
jgi:hypothetical protein